MPLWHSKCIGNTNFKRIITWLTELQKTAQHADHAWQSALQAQFQKVTSTRSTLTYASTAVHVQMLAQWVQSFLSSLSTEEKRSGSLNFRTFFCMYRLLISVEPILSVLGCSVQGWPEEQT